MTINVNEIFYSIQGESSFAGRPCIFVRLTGCNLRCAYCDTQYAYGEGEALSLAAVLERVGAYPCRLVELTGGEPLLQEPAPELIAGLLDRGYTVLLETNGSQDISRADSRCIRIVDVKCPSSGEAASFDSANLDRLGSRDEVKFVVGSRADYEYARDMLRQVRERTAVAHIHFSPVHALLEPERLAGWILEDGLEVSLGLQLHKLLWPDRQRGA
ncbi:radical SAM protein [Thermodesulfobacteriota bacterium]